MENITITSKTKSTANTNNGDGSKYSLGDFGMAALGTGVSAGEFLLHNKVDWYSFKQNKFYSRKFFGNQYTTGEQKAAKALGVKLTRVGYALALWNMYDINRQYQNNEIGTGQMVAEQGVNTISTFGGIRTEKDPLFPCRPCAE